MNRTIATLATAAVLLGATGAPYSNAEARNPNSAKETHYYSPPILLLPYMEQLSVCVADAARAGAAGRKQSLYFPESMLEEINVFGMDGALLAAKEASLEPDQLGACFDIATKELGPPGGSPPETILVELIVSVAAESKAVPIVTFEPKDSRSNTSIAVLIPAAQADAPAPPAQKKWQNYSGGFVLGDSLSDSLTHIFGPFTLTAGQEVDICAADAAALANATIPLDFTEIVWTVEVHAARRKGDTTLDDVILVKEIDRSSPKANCTGAITVNDILQEPPSHPVPEPIVVVILLYAEAPPGTQVAPMATGRLKPIIFDEPEPVPLLLPAVQAAREPAR